MHTIYAGDFHFGREGYETPEGQRKKVKASENLADYLINLSYYNGKPDIIIQGDLFHRPHWSEATQDKNKEGFNGVESLKQIGSLSEELRRGYRMTLLDGNCDPWMIMQKKGIVIEDFIHLLLNDLKKDIDVRFAGAATQTPSTFVTHGHKAEDMTALIRTAIGFPSRRRILKKALDASDEIDGVVSVSQEDVQEDEKGSSLAHHIIAQTLMRMEKWEGKGTEIITRKLRATGNIVLSAGVAQIMEEQSLGVSPFPQTGIFGHTHHMSHYTREQLEKTTGVTLSQTRDVWNTGSATGDLKHYGYGTFIVEREQPNGSKLMAPMYSYHPDNPDEVIEMPYEHLQAFNDGKLKGVRE